MLLPPLTFTNLRLTYRCEQAMCLPRWKGALLRGGWGRALRGVFCVRDCADPKTCERACPYRTLFTPESPEPTQKGVQDMPRPFIVRPPLDERTDYHAGDQLTFEVISIGSTQQYLTHMIAAFEELGRMGLGEARGKAHLERVTSRNIATASEQPLLVDGQWYGTATAITPDQIATVSEYLGMTLTLHFLTPTRIKQRGDWARVLDAPTVFAALERRLRHMSTFYGAQDWTINPDPLFEQARAVRITRMNTRWVEWGRTSGGTGQHMQLGGVVGTVEYANIAPWLRMVLLIGSYLHVGKATVFGHGWYRVG